jgi:integrase
MTRSEFAHFEPILDASGRIIGYRVFVSRGFRTDGSRNRASRTVRGSKHKADLVARALYESLADPTTADAPLTLRAFVDGEWLEWERKNPKVRDSTLTGYESKLRCHVLPVLGDRLIARVTVKDLDDLFVALPDSGLGPRTIQHVYRALSLVMKYAKRWKHITANPFDDTDPPTVEDDAYPDALSLAEARRYFDAFRGHALEPMVLMSLGAGLRTSEADGAEWECIGADGVYRLTHGLHQRGKRVWTEPLKTRASKRPTPLVPWVHTRLEELRAIGPLVPGVDGAHMTPAHVTAEYERIVKAFRLRRVTRKNLRHSFANMLKAQGVSPYVIAMLMRHATVKTTEDFYFDADLTPMLVGTGALDGALRGFDSDIGVTVTTS